MTEISDIETRIRVFIYTHIAEFGAPPTADRIAAEMSLTVDDARAALEALAVNRQVILDPTTSRNLDGRPVLRRADALSRPRREGQLVG